MSMLIAEELEVDLPQITLEAAPPNDKLYANPLLGFQVTGGSTSVMAMWEPLRRAGAVARVLLIAAAAAQWNVDPSSCRAEHGEVIHPPTGQRLKYGAIVDAAAKLPVPARVTLKDPKDFTLIGTPAKRIDTPDKVNGKAGIRPGIVVSDPAKHLLGLQTPKREENASWLNGINRPVVNVAHVERGLVDYVVRVECDT
jgi:CO/xanthine dehydrogenase Mo-binding subunit